MPGTKYERALSQDSSIVGCEEYPEVDRKNAEHDIKIRRRAVIISIITIFTVTTIIMVMSVVYVEMNKSNAGYEELICQETDTECFKLLCPQGWGWDREKEECAVLEGRNNIYLLFKDLNIAFQTMIKISFDFLKYFCALAGYACCPAMHHLCGESVLVRCYNQSTSHDCSCTVPAVQRVGVVTSGYKQVCHNNYIWVDWRKKCLRRN